MAYDLSRCPQNLAEMEDYFFTLIQRRKGDRADNWQGVMLNSNIPHNVYVPGTRADASWPLFGLTQQWSNGPKARVFMPSATADENGYFTRCMQYLDDGPDGVLVWAWYYIAGHDYAPVQGATATPPGTQPPVIIAPGAGLTEAEVQAMIDDSIEQALASFTGIKFGDKIALRTNSGLIAGIEGGGPTEVDAPIKFIGKDHIHAWESFEIEKGE